MNLNKVFFAGNLCRDPQTAMLPSNKPVCEFNVASNRKWRTESGEMKEDVCFVDCKAFGKTAELIGQHFSKGKPIFIEGRLKYEQWETKDNQKRSKLVIFVDNFQFVGSRGEHKDDSNQKSLDDAAVAAVNKDDGDYPF